MNSLFQPIAYPQAGQPAQMPQAGQPAQFPQAGQPAMSMNGMPQQLSSNSPYPQEGQPAQMPQSGQPAQFPQAGQPAQDPSEGRPTMSMADKPKWSVGDPHLDKYINMFIG